MKEVYSILGTAVEREAELATLVLLLQQDAAAGLGPIGGDASEQYGELVFRPGPQRSLSVDCSRLTRTSQKPAQLLHAIHSPCARYATAEEHDTSFDAYILSLGEPQGWRTPMTRIH